MSDLRSDPLKTPFLAPEENAMQRTPFAPQGEGASQLQISRARKDTWLSE